MNSVLSRLSLRARFQLVSLVFILLGLVPLLFLLSDSIAEIRATQSEVDGLIPTRSVLELTRLLQQHRGLSAAQLNGAQDAAAARAPLVQKIQAAADRAVADLGTVESAQGELAASVKQAAAEARDLAAQVDARQISAPDSFRQHTALVAQLLQVSFDTTRKTGLLLDPRAEGYFLIIAGFQEGPRLAEQIGRLRGFGAGVLAGGQAGQPDRLRISSMLGQIDSRLEGLQRHLDAALKSDPLLRGRLQAPYEAAMQAVQVFVKTSQAQLLGAEPATMAQRAYFGLGTKAVDAQMSLTDEVVDELSKRLGARLRHMQRQLAGVLACVLVLAVLALRALFVLASGILVPIKALAQAAQRLAQGDLSVPIHARHAAELGELERNLEATRTTWAEIVSHLQASAQAVWNAAESIRHGNHDLEQRTGATVGSLQQTASSVGQLTASVAQTSENAQEASRLADGAVSAAQHGGEIVSQVVGGMQDIEQASRRISEIIGTIDGIAFQTNILALNAAVEAARAGEQGRGFAVVASEVRVLAQRSAQAAREIKGLISSSGDKVSSGVALVQEAGASMQDIMGRVQRVTDMINGITGAAMEQSSGIGLVNQAVGNLDDMAQRNAELVEQSGMAAQDLSDQATRLREMAYRFRLA